MRLTPAPIDPAELQRFMTAARTVLMRDETVLAAWLFGSAARGEPVRDLDVALLTTAALDPWHFERLRAELEAVGIIGFDVDLRLLAGASPRFRATVLREGRLLYERSLAARVTFRSSSGVGMARLQARVAPAAHGGPRAMVAMSEAHIDLLARLVHKLVLTVTHGEGVRPRSRLPHLPRGSGLP
jgi:predicted nucleotidyltransferase